MQGINRKLPRLSCLLSLCSLIFLACGKGSHSSQSADDPLAQYLATLSGSISTHSGSQSDLAGWAIALIDRESQIARVATLDQAGLFSFSHVYSSLDYTVALFSPSLILRAVLAHPGGSSGRLHTYFRLKSDSLLLPRLINKGLTLSWQDLTGLELTEPSVNDANRTGVPEGVYEALAGSLALGLVSSNKADAQAKANSSDLNENGLINILDPNNDGDVDELGNPLLDDFDTDANGDLTPDSQQGSGDIYFSRGAHWVMVQYEMSPSDTEGVFKRQMTFTLKLHPDLKEKPQSVRIRRSPSLPFLQNATLSVSSAGSAASEPTALAWDGQLLDNGQSEDSAAEDGLYAAKVTLKAGSTPSANQAIIFQITVEEGWTEEFIYLLPPISPLPIRPSYEAITRTVTFKTPADDQPFGQQLNFVWIVSVFAVQADGSLTQVYNSQALAGKEKSLVLPANIIEAGKNYRYKVMAQSQEKVGGYAYAKIASKMLPLE